MSVSVTLTFVYPWNEPIEDEDEDEVISCLEELAPEELLLNACKACKPINVDIEVY